MKGIGLIDILGVIIVVALVFLVDSFSPDPGTGWHLQTGRWIVEQAQVPQTDPFLATPVPKSWIANQWASDVLLWCLYHVGHWAMLEMLVVVVVMLLYLGVLAPLLRRFEIPSFAAVPLTLLSMLLCYLQWFLRPVVFSFLLFGVVLSVVCKWMLLPEDKLTKRDRLQFFALPLVFVLWANLHPAFPLGLGVVFLALVSLCLQPAAAGGRSMLIPAASVFVCCLLATLLNPYGPALYGNIFGLVGDSFFMDLNVEWKSPDLQNKVFWPFGVSVFFLAFIGLRFGRGALSLFDVLVLGAFLYASFMHRRYIPFFGIAVLLPLALCVKEVLRSSAEQAQGFGLKILTAMQKISIKDKRRSQGGYTFCLIVLLLGCSLQQGHRPAFCYNDAEKDSKSSGALCRDSKGDSISAKFPAEALAALVREEESEDDGVFGKIFHTPDWGGFITWKLWPKGRASIDDRNQLNGQKSYEDFLDAYKARPNWKVILDKHNFEWALLEEGAALELMLENSPYWVERYRDDKAILYRRAGSSGGDVSVGVL